MENYPDCARLIQEGKCKADCCGPAPMPRWTWNKHRFSITRPVARFEEFSDEGDNVLPISSDLHCVFLGMDYRCVIQEDKPPICLLFGSPGCHPALRCPHAS